MGCGKKVSLNYKICPYCGFNYTEYMKPSMPIFGSKKQKKEKKSMFTNAEALSMGVYPKTESYKRSIMSIMYDEE